MFTGYLIGIKHYSHADMAFNLVEQHWQIGNTWQYILQYPTAKYSVDFLLHGLLIPKFAVGAHFLFPAKSASPPFPRKPELCARPWPLPLPPPPFSLLLQPSFGLLPLRNEEEGGVCV